MSSSESSPELVSRRRFLTRVIFGLSGLAGAVVSIPILAYLLSPLISPAKNVWRDLGPVDNYKVGSTVQAAIQEPSPLPWAGQTAQTAVWVRRTGQASFIVFAVNCTHLGCPVRWLPEADLFMCPCHGGVYYKDGKNAAGPPPRALFRYDVRVRNGDVEIQTGPLPIV